MKYVYMALAAPLLFLVGVYAGLEWGLTAKPILDESKCRVVTRYEDNTLVCVPLFENTATPLEVEKARADALSPRTYNPQLTQDAWHLQPARGE